MLNTIKNITPQNSTTILLIAAAMGIGLGFEHPSFIFTLPDLLSLASVFLIIRGDITKEFSFIKISFILSFLTIIYVNVTDIETSSLHPFLSLIYFYKPYLTFLLGYAILNNRKNLEYFFLAYLFFSLFLLLFVFYRVLTKPYSPDLSHFFHNISIVGANGRNAYLVMVALSAMIGMVLLFSSTNKKYQWFAGIYMVIASLLVGIAISRQAILALLAFYLLFGINVLLRGNKYQRILLLSTLLLYALGFFFFQKIIAGFWETKITRDVQAIAKLDINKFSADRLTIYYALIKDIIHSPFIGIAFKSLPSYLSEIPSQLGPHTQLSPHSQYLGAYWKMGLIPFVFYIYFLGTLYYCVWKLNKIQQDMFYYGVLAITTVMLFVLAFFQDVLLFPLSGVLFSLICGGCVAMLKNNSSITK